MLHQIMFEFAALEVPYLPRINGLIQYESLPQLSQSKNLWLWGWDRDWHSCSRCLLCRGRPLTPAANSFHQAVLRQKFARPSPTQHSPTDYSHGSQGLRTTEKISHESPSHWGPSRTHRRCFCCRASAHSLWAHHCLYCTTVWLLPNPRHTLCVANHPDRKQTTATSSSDPPS